MFGVYGNGHLLQIEAQRLILSGDGPDDVIDVWSDCQQNLKASFVIIELLQDYRHR